MGCVDIIVTLKNREKQKKNTNKPENDRRKTVKKSHISIRIKRSSDLKKKTLERLYFKIIDFYNSLLNKTNLLIFLSLSRFLFRP